MKLTAFHGTNEIASLTIIRKDIWQKKLHPSLGGILEKSIKRIDEELLGRAYSPPANKPITYALPDEKNNVIAFYTLHNTATLRQLPNLMAGIANLLKEAKRQMLLPEPEAKFWERNKRKKTSSDT